MITMLCAKAVLATLLAVTTPLFQPYLPRPAPSNDGTMSSTVQLTVDLARVSGQLYPSITYHVKNVGPQSITILPQVESNGQITRDGQPVQREAALCPQTLFDASGYSGAHQDSIYKTIKAGETVSITSTTALCGIDFTRPGVYAGDAQLFVRTQDDYTKIHGFTHVGWTFRS